MPAAKIRMTSTRHKVILGKRMPDMVQLLSSSTSDVECFSLDSARATWRRLSVNQYRPPSSELPISTTVGTSPREPAVNVGRGRLLGAARKPSFSKGTSDRKNTEVPPTSSLP